MWFKEELEATVRYIKSLLIEYIGVRRFEYLLIIFVICTSLTTLAMLTFPVYREFSDYVHSISQKKVSKMQLLLENQINQEFYEQVFFASLRGTAREKTGLTEITQKNIFYWRLCCCT